MEYKVAATTLYSVRYAMIDEGSDRQSLPLTAAGLSKIKDLRSA
ncbi:hypothetical protein [Thermoactinomyces mirandus]|nr:hypothetical protein [Thermoactinomyces mirandus]